MGKKSKPALNASGCHSKLVKAGVATSLFKTATKKSCVHFLSKSLNCQRVGLRQAGYNQLKAYVITFIYLLYTGCQRGSVKKSRKKLGVMKAWDLLYAALGGFCRLLYGFSLVQLINYCNSGN